MTDDEIQKLAKRVFRRLGLGPEHVKRAGTVEFPTLGWYGSVLWGVTGDDPRRADCYSVHVDLDGKLPQAMVCNCGDRLKPCVHAQAIVLRAKQDISQFEEHEPSRTFAEQARYDPTWE